MINTQIATDPMNREHPVIPQQYRDIIGGMMRRSKQMSDESPPLDWLEQAEELYDGNFEEMVEWHDEIITDEEYDDARR